MAWRRLGGSFVTTGCKRWLGGGTSGGLGLVEELPAYPASLSASKIPPVGLRMGPIP